MVNEGRLVNEKRRALVNDIYERYTTEIENSFVNTTICENNDLRSKRVTGTKQTDIVFEHMAVSYTHLDVYKRQVKDTVEIVERITPIYNFKAH